MDRRARPGKALDNGSTIEHMDTPADTAAARAKAIDETSGSAEDTFEPGYLERLRHDWPD
jgi:hypothetical protein